MRSVHLTNYYHKNSGGISTSYNNLLAAAERHRRYIRLIVPGETESVEDVNEFAKIYYVPARYSPFFDKRYRIMMPWQYTFNDTAIRRVLLAEMPDMIEVTDKYTLSMIGGMIRRNNFKMIGRPMLVHFSCERMDDNIASFVTDGRFGRWMARRLMGDYILPSYDFHIANSAYTAEEFYSALRARSGKFRDMFWRFLAASRVPFSERIFVCPRGVDAQQFSPERKNDAARRLMIERAGVPDDAVVLLYAGRVSPEKNIRLLAGMMEILAKDSGRDHRLLVAGDGPMVGWLKERGDEDAAGKIVLLGHLDKETLADYYANADVFVHPNPREPFGIAPLEAMASGVPTVAPRAGGILSYASDDNAWLVEPAAEAFADAVRDAVSDAEAAGRKTANAVETARANTREKSTDHLLATYDKMYEDFMRRNELFTDMKASRAADLVELTNA